MPCQLAIDLAAASDCGAVAAGLDEQELWLFNRADVTFGALGTGTAARTYSTMTVAATKQAYRWNFDKRGFAFSDEMTEDENTGAITHAPRITGRLIGLTGANAVAVEALKGTNLVAVFKTKGGKYIIAGYGSGLTLKVNTTGSASESLGETVELGSDDEPSKHYELLITDASSTKAALIAAETPSSGS